MLSHPLAEPLCIERAKLSACISNFIDLFDINTLTNIDAVTVTGSTGVDIVNLSPTMTTSGKTTVDLGSDSAAWFG